VTLLGCVAKAVSDEESFGDIVIRFASVGACEELAASDEDRVY